MQTDAVLSFARMMAFEEFSRLLGKAQTGALFHGLFAGGGRLENFRDLQPALNPAGQYRGMREIPVERIVGSVDRGADFDRDFRPLLEHLRDRWINVYLLNQELGFPPIRVYKVGSNFYVEDGHNRVSVARQFGMPVIRAEVWEYTFKRQPAENPACPGRYCDLPLAEC